MQILLESSLQGFVEQAVRSGRFGSAEEVVREGLRLVQERERKLAELRAKVEAAIAEGGEVSEEELDVSLAEAAEELARQGY